jgi:flagellar hook-associated protein FlgK
LPHIALEDLINVSLDEEQVNLMRFQQAFAAAAHLFRVAQALSTVRSKYGAGLT